MSPCPGSFLRTLCTCSLLLGISLLARLKSSAQSYLTAIGSHIFSTTVPVDNGDINISNGNLQLSFPLASATQRGGALSAAEGLVYDGRIWQIVFNGSTYSWQPTNVPSSSAGWRFINAQSGTLQTVNTTSTCDVSPPRAAWRTSSYSYVDPAGAVHGFGVYTTYQYTARQSNACYDSTQPNITAVDGLAYDGSGYHLYVTATSTTVYDRNGGQVYPKVEDKNGNYFSKDANGNLIDTRGQTPVLVTTNGSTTYYDVLGFGGVRNRYTVVSGPISVNTGFNQSAVKDWTGTLTAIQSISLPGNQGAYQFSYDAYGEISSVVLPSGGTVGYGWSNYVDSYQNANRWLTSRTRDGATWTYIPSVVTQCSSGGTGCVEQVTMTSPTPTANDTVYKLTLNNGAWNSEIDHYTGTGSGRGLLQADTTAYDFSPTCDPNLCTGSDYTRATTNTTTLSDVGLSRSEVYTYDSLTTGNLTADKVYDFYSGNLPSQPTEETDYVYGYTGTNAQPSITKTTVLSYALGSATQVSQTVQGYDGKSLVGTNSLSNHEILSGTKANLTSVGQWVNSSNSFLTTTYSLDDAGMQRISTDANGPTTYAYDASGTFPMLVTLPMSSSGISLSTSVAYDSYTGLPSSTTDANKQVTQYQGYDPFMRPLEIDYPDGGKTTYAYTSTHKTTYFYQNSNHWSDIQVSYDGYGRAWRVATARGGQSYWGTQQDTCYDSSSRTSFLSAPYQGNYWTGSPVCSGAGDAYSYDALSRTTQLVHADGSSRLNRYVGRSTLAIDENNVSRITQVDTLNRPTIVCELSSNQNMPASGSPVSCGTDYAGIGFTTNYGYNLPNHSTTITAGAQTRIFQTDSLGRTVYTQEPEAGVTSFSYAYNSTGLAVTRRRPKANQSNASVFTNTITQFDALSRPITINYDDGLTPNKLFSYDSSAGWGSFVQTNLLGRLSMSMALGNVGGSTYSYDQMGRVIGLHECVPSTCGTSDRALSYSYDAEGNLLSASDGAGVSTSYNGYTQDNLIGSITSSLNDARHPGTLVANTSYGPFGVTNYNLGNGLNEIMQYDGTGHTSSGSLCVGSTQPSCIGGTQMYTYTMGWRGDHALSGCDSVQGQCTNYGYDEFSRLSSRTVTQGTAQNFTYAYDRYGNRWQQNAGQSGPAPSLSFNVNTNQVVSSGYDAAGNMTSDSFHGYQYDAEGNVINVDNGAATYAYDASNHRIRANIGGNSLEFLFNASEQRVSTWNASTQQLVEGQHYWGSLPIGYYTTADNSTHFEHGDWIGTERLRTTYNGGLDNSFTSLPFGDASTTVTGTGTDSDTHHFALLDHDGASFTDHAQFRQYSNVEGRWFSPDPYSGSYDPGNPQSLNRYSYVLNNPLSGVDPSGKDPIFTLTVTVLAFTPIDAPFVAVLGTLSAIGSALGLNALFFHPPTFHGSLHETPKNPHTQCPSGTYADTSGTPDYQGGATEYGVNADGTPTRFAGRRTASGSIFDPWGYTAATIQGPPGARWTIPKNTFLNVVSASNPAANVVVQVTDTGILGPGDVIDLSAGAMKTLTGKPFNSIPVKMYNCRAR